MRTSSFLHPHCWIPARGVRSHGRHHIVKHRRRLASRTSLMATRTWEFSILATPRRVES